MRVRVGCEFECRSDFEVAGVLLVRARADGAHHTVYESQWADPAVPLNDYRDAFDNPCWRLVFPVGLSTVRYDAVVDIDEEPDPTHPGALLAAPADLPDEVLGYTLASRYVESDVLGDAAWSLFGHTAPTWERVQAICDWVHENIRYEAGSSTSRVTAVDVYERRVGVCRDFALLVIAFCRAMNIPARYTFGYLPDIAVDPPDTPMDFHAWCEVFVGDRWYTFDARHNRPRIGRVVVGYGRDATDVAMLTSYGALQLARMTVWAEEVASDETALPSLAAPSLAAPSLAGAAAVAASAESSA